MIPRKKIDISFSDLAFAVSFCLLGNDAETLEHHINSVWPSKVRILPSLSVRSGFDATLQALNLPRGSEVLVSALTIRDMEKIILKHGLIPVPIDINLHRLDLDFTSLEAAVSEKTRVILIAHLFGSRMRMDPIVEFARCHGLLLFEDCAQAFVGREYQGDSRSDVRMFSFGPIKTATALGGALLYFRNESLREKADQIQGAWPRYGQFKFLKRIIKYAVISCLTCRPVYGFFVAACSVFGSDHEKILGKNVRGFAGSNFFSQIRQRPSLALLALLARRLERFDPARIVERRQAARAMFDRLPDENLVGKDANDHSFWVFPILSEDHDGLVRFLWNRGFDATKGQSSMIVVDCPDDMRTKPIRATEAYDKLLYIPVPSNLCDRDAERLIDSLHEFRAKGSVKPTF